MYSHEIGSRLVVRNLCPQLAITAGGDVKNPVDMVEPPLTCELRDEGAVDACLFLCGHSRDQCPICLH